MDFDALWGHRRNVKGYAEELERFDVKLGEFLGGLREDDLLSLLQITEMTRRTQEQTIQEKWFRFLHILHLWKDTENCRIQIHLQ